MKFFSSVSFFLLLLTGATTVNAVASTAEKACSHLHKVTLNVKVGASCKFWQSNGHAVDGTCQKRNGHHLFNRMTCVPGSSSTSGASSPSATSSAAVSSTDTSGASSTGSDGTGSDGTGSDGTSM